MISRFFITTAGSVGSKALKYSGEYSKLISIKSRPLLRARSLTSHVLPTCRAPLRTRGFLFSFFNQDKSLSVANRLINSIVRGKDRKINNIRKNNALFLLSNQIFNALISLDRQQKAAQSRMHGRDTVSYRRNGKRSRPGSRRLRPGPGYSELIKVNICSFNIS